MNPKIPKSDSPVVLVVDSREPEGAGWEPFFTLPFIRQKLDTGDFSKLGCDTQVGIERKTVDDLIGCFCQSRERFVRELQRFQAIPDRWIICEGSYASLLAGRYRSQMRPKSAWESAIALMTRYRIPLLMADNAETGAHLCQSLLHRWFKERERVIDECRKASHKLLKSA